MELTSSAPAVGILGGGGGAGASTVAAALALRAGASVLTCLVDGDPWGSGVDRILGLERLPGIRWEELAQTSGRFGSQAMCGVLPREGQLTFIGWGDAGRFLPGAATVTNALDAAREGHAAVIVDVPRAGVILGAEAALALVADLDRIFLVVRSSMAGLASAARTVSAVNAALPSVTDRMVAVVRGGGIDHLRVERTLHIPVLTTFGSERGMDEQVDLGLGPVRSHRSPVARLTGAMWEQVGAGAGYSSDLGRAA